MFRLGYVLPLVRYVEKPSVSIVESEVQLAGGARAGRGSGGAGAVLIVVERFVLAGRDRHRERARTAGGRRRPGHERIGAGVVGQRPGPVGVPGRNRARADRDDRRRGAGRRRSDPDGHGAEQHHRQHDGWQLPSRSSGRAEAQQGPDDRTMHVFPRRTARVGCPRASPGRPADDRMRTNLKISPFVPLSPNRDFAGNCRDKRARLRRSDHRERGGQRERELQPAGREHYGGRSERAALAAH